MDINKERPVPSCEWSQFVDDDDDFSNSNSPITEGLLKLKISFILCEIEQHLSRGQQLWRWSLSTILTYTISYEKQWVSVAQRSKCVGTLYVV